MTEIHSEVGSIVNHVKDQMEKESDTKDILYFVHSLILDAGLIRQILYKEQQVLFDGSTSAAIKNQKGSSMLGPISNSSVSGGRMQGKRANDDDSEESPDRGGGAMSFPSHQSTRSLKHTQKTQSVTGSVKHAGQSGLKQH